MSTVDHYGSLHRAATGEGIPADEVARFAELLRFAVWANEKYEGEIVAHPRGLPPGQSDDLLVGRAGGLPDLPVGMPWPADEEGVPLPFVASFDCAALPRVEGLPLPPDGSLLIFLHHEEAYDADDRDEEQQFARVIHVPAGTGTVAAPPEDYPSRPFCTDLGFIGPERDLFAVVHAELPEWVGRDEAKLSPFQQRLARDLPHRRELCAVVDRLWPAGNSATFQFGGYSWHTGGVSRGHLYDEPELAIAEKNVRGGDVEEELQRVRREWIPLVQFEPNDDVYYGRFLIRVEDLAAGRFDRAVSWTEFTE
ncbi:YwqG family protein [Actinoplanes sp. NPDC023714]|uniref:YwqG family protein n=1 Tax=Actinoplanes sp. NPDC023714 TaxID=3154322 RepID=UPI0033D2C432